MAETEQEDVPPMEGKLGCFYDQSRVCGPDCMAYLAQVPEGKAYLGENWAHCKQLVTADQVGRHVIIIADLLQRVRVAQATQERAKPPPGVI